MWPLSEEARNALRTTNTFTLEVSAWQAGGFGARKIADLVISEATLSVDYSRRVRWQGSFKAAPKTYEGQDVYTILDPSYGTWIELFYIINLPLGGREKIPFPPLVVDEIEQENLSAPIDVTVVSPEIFIEDNVLGYTQVWERVDLYLTGEDSLQPTSAEICNLAYQMSTPKNFPIGNLVDNAQTRDGLESQQSYFQTSSGDLAKSVDDECESQSARWYVGRDKAIHVDPYYVSKPPALYTVNAGERGVVLSESRKKSRRAIYNYVEYLSNVDGEAIAVDQEMIDRMGPKQYSQETGKVIYDDQNITASFMLSRLKSQIPPLKIELPPSPHLDVGDCLNLNTLLYTGYFTLISAEFDLSGGPTSVVVQKLDDLSYQLENSQEA